ncbi:ubiquitin thioesterase OTUB2 isoform X2 [Rattus rattus]|uniref:ubiquitin thioesterase OTUB2 isoform X2 n=1 Tax=Rattus rattus TaxID=10117 RepID=UPI0013F30049|nr:ubiquitin thioesterase OTUB2 isoform X2 [Rattus rattus]
MALPSSLQDFIPHFHLRLHPHGLFYATSCRRSRTESSGKTPTLRSALRPVLPTPKSPFVVCSQLRRLLQHPPGKCPGCSHSPAPKPSHLQSETSFNLISEKCDILSILRDHPENRIYQRKIQELSKRFTSIRKTKGDGNCFYRALGYSYLESLLGKGREILKFKERVLQTPNDLLAAGFEEHKFRNFFNAFYSVVELVEKDSSVSSLLKVFNDQSSSDRIVQFLRLLTSAFIRNRADFFRHFIDEEMDIKDFCTHEVEPMAMECDHVQITALSQALNIALQVEYVDEMDTALNHHVFPEAATPSVYLLYKTSHYNILYAAEKH